MKKQTLILVAIMVFALKTSAQNLLGIPFKGTTASYVNALVKQKGFKVIQAETKTVKGYLLKGKILGYDCEVIVIGTPKTSQVCKVIAFTSPTNNFTTLTNTFDNIYGLLESKYGKSDDDCVDFFQSPYERHDGYEITAIQVGKYVRMCGFADKEPNLSVFVAIEEEPQVKIIWENKQNMALVEKERTDNAKNEL